RGRVSNGDGLFTGRRELAGGQPLLKKLVPGRLLGGTGCVRECEYGRQAAQHAGRRRPPEMRRHGHCSLCQRVKALRALNLSQELWKVKKIGHKAWSLSRLERWPTARRPRPEIPYFRWLSGLTAVR